MRLSNKTAIVTGGASGFGAGIVRKFHAEGAKVLIADLNTELAEELAAELGEGIRVCTTNVAKAADVDAMTQAALSAFGQIGHSGQQRRHHTFARTNGRGQRRGF